LINRFWLLVPSWPRQPGRLGASLAAGFWSSEDGTSHGLAADTIAAWANPRGFAGVIWTNLPPKVKGVDGFVPSEDAVIEYVSSLTGAERQAAVSYVRKAPA
jgi:hypothetical protein